MINIDNKTKCCGCQACYNICPKDAIEMVADEKGFKYPEVNKDKCINCGLCEKVCPILNNKQIENEPRAYACINKDKKIREESTSGGIFTLLASAVINDGGVVFGACFDENFGVYHTYCEKFEDLGKYRSSKYLQSDMGLSYKKAKEFLDQGRKVLFTGTPCQIEAIKSYLGKEYDNLYLQDIVCHGVPSPMIWDKYKSYREEKANSKLSKMSFRSKKNTTWSSYNIDMNFDNKTSYTINHNDDVYMKAFLKHLSLRESCTDCKFKKNNRLSDITLADFWGIRNVKPEMDDGKGTSLVVVNSKKGQELFDLLKDSMICEKVDFEKAISGNSSFNTISKFNRKTNKFYDEVLKNNNFELVVKKYTFEVDIYGIIKKKIKRIIKKI